MSTYFSDRERGPRPRTVATFSTSAWGGIVAAVNGRVATGAFGASFPDLCSDGQGVSGTSDYSMGLAVLAEIRELADAPPTESVRWGPDDFTGWPLQANRVPSTLAILDLVEFCFRHVAQPTEIEYHSFLRHSHLRYKQTKGQEGWLADVNGLFSRNALAYELTTTGKVVRLGMPITTEVVRLALFATGDTALDDLLERARQKYLSFDPRKRTESLEQLWDAFERSKTILAPDKKAGIRALIERKASSPELAAQLEAEASILTTIGNDFRIRHHETTKHAVAIGDVDYLFHRCFALLAHLLSLSPSP